MPHAVAVAREAVEALGPQFEGAEAAEVHAVTRSTLDFDSEQQDPEETVQYSIRFVQPMGDTYVEGPGTGITVTVDGDGVCDMTGFWLEEEGCVETGARKRPIDPEGAQLGRCKVGEALKVADEDLSIRSVDLVYQVDPRAEPGEVNLVPAWRYELEGGEAFCCDADA